MKICADHWVWLRRALVDRGLGELMWIGEAPHVVEPISAADIGKRWDFDALVGAGAVITNGYLEDYELAGAIGEACPLCLVDSDNPGAAHRWINGAADAMLVEARRLRLAPPPQ